MINDDFSSDSLQIKLDLPLNQPANEIEIALDRNLQNENLSIRSINVCNANKLLTVRNAIEYAKIHGSFMALKNCGAKTNAELLAMCSKYMPNDIPAFPIALNGDTNTLADDVLNMDIKYLKPLIKHRLYLDLQSNGISDIRSFLKLNLKEFEKKVSLSPELFKNLRCVYKIANKKPGKILRNVNKYVKEKVLPFDESESMLPITSDFLVIFKNIVEGYFEILDKHIEKDILIKRYGLLDGKEYTLEELSVYFDCARQHIQYSENNILKKLRSLISGQSLLKPSCRCNKKHVEFLGNLSHELKNQSIISCAQIKSICKNYNGLALSVKTIPFFKLLLEIWNIVEVNVDSDIIYMTNQDIDKKIVFKAYKIIIKTLENAVKPIDFFDIVLAVKKPLNSCTIANDTIKVICNSLENIDILADGKYQLKFHHLTSLSDCAFRILFEKQESMTYNDIWREIAHRFTLTKTERKGTAKSLSTQLSMDQRFSAIGKSGFWALSEWGVNSDTILRLILDSFYSFNRPCGIEEIAKYIGGIRPKVDRKSIVAIILMNKDKFRRIKNGHFILKEWGDNYEAHKPDKRAAAIKKQEFYHILKEVFSEQNAGRIQGPILKRLIRQKGVDWSDSAFYTRFNSSKSLLKTTEGSKVFYQFIGNEEEVQKTNKSSEIESAIIQAFLCSNENQLRLSSIVKLLAKSYCFPRPSIYKTISDSTRLHKITDTSGKIYIALKNSQSNHKIDYAYRQESLREIIKTGESDKAEFKSTLRWDIKENRINTELEFVIAKTIAAFLNSEGGKLFIGIDDNGHILGLSLDYLTFKKQNRDGFLLQLNNVIIQWFSKEMYSQILPVIENIDDKEICLIEIKQSNQPVFLKKEARDFFFIRAANSVQLLDIKDAVGYIKSHWK